MGVSLVDFSGTILTDLLVPTQSYCLKDLQRACLLKQVPTVFSVALK